MCNPAIKRSDVIFKDLLCVLLLSSLVVVVFWRVIFQSVSISKLGYIADWDSLYYAYGKGVHASLDPSSVLMLVPLNLLAAQIWHSLELPLWNQYSGLGAPLWGDIQAYVLAPTNLLFLIFPNLHTHNLSLVMKPILAIIGTFLFCRRLGLERSTASFSALAYAFCPMFFYFLISNTATTYALAPIVFWGFLFMIQRQCLLAGTSAGCLSALLILSGHPEGSFWAIMFAVLFSALVVIGYFRNKKFWGAIICYIRLLCWTAFTTFCLTAPILLPFIEFLLNSNTYKLTVDVSSFVPWQTILYNLVHPGFSEASPYLGIVTVALIGAAFTTKNQAKAMVSSLALTGIIAFVIISRLGIANDLLSLKPFKPLVTSYCLPVFLLMLCCIAGFGLKQLVCRPRLAGYLTIIMGALALAIPPELNKCHWLIDSGNFDATLPAMSFSWVHWKRIVVIFAFFTAGILIRQFDKFKNQRYIVILSMVLVLIGLMSLNGKNLQAQAKFFFPREQPLRFLASTNERMIATGEHLFKSSSNLAYRIYDLRSLNPMFPARYPKFMQAAGAKVDQFSQKFLSPLSHLLDVISVKYVLSEDPVFAEDDSFTNSQTITIPNGKRVMAPGLVLKKGFFQYDQTSRAIIGKLYWQVSAGHNSRYSASLVLLDANGGVLYFSDYYILPSISSSSLDQPNRTFLMVGQTAQPINVCTPSNFTANQKWFLGVQVFDNVSRQFIPTALNTIDPKRIIGLLSQVKPSEFGITTEFHYKLIQEYGQGHKFRIYENLRSLPRQYLVDQAVFVKSGQDALKIISSASFNPRKKVVIEQEPKEQTISQQLLPQVVPSNGNLFLKDQIYLERLKDNELALKASSQKPCFLVTTDLVYPGWRAFVDKKEVPLLKANYVCRAVFLQPGSHFIELKYEPVSFRFGVLLALAYAGSWLFVFLCRRIAL